jgi:IS605 OrfB family transposase
MHREVTTTVRVKLHSLTEKKAQLVEREYGAFQDAVHGDNGAILYSDTKQQAVKVRSNQNPRADTEQPIILRNDCITIEHDDVLAVDMGAKWITVGTFLSDRDTQFHGAEVRRVREHYKQLRKSIGKAKVRSGAQVIERLGDKESRTGEHELHQVANELIARAQERNAVIVYGDMTGLRFDNDNGLYVNDKTHKMPYAKMANILTYKSHLDSRACIPVNEYDTSVTCWQCGSQDTSRGVQGACRVPRLWSGRHRRQEWSDEHRQTSRR